MKCQSDVEQLEAVHWNRLSSHLCQTLRDSKERFEERRARGEGGGGCVHCCLMNQYFVCAPLLKDFHSARVAGADLLVRRLVQQ
jgi:hypothetical protein